MLLTCHSLTRAYKTVPPVLYTMPVCVCVCVCVHVCAHAYVYLHREPETGGEGRVRKTARSHLVSW